MSINATARGGGYYVVYALDAPIPKDVQDGESWMILHGLRLTQHTQEREALEQCSEFLEAMKNGAPKKYIYYLHEMCVSVVETLIANAIPITPSTPLPPPPDVPTPTMPETVPQGEALDFLDLIEKFMPAYDPLKSYKIAAPNFYAGLDVALDRHKNDWLTHMMYYGSPDPDGIIRPKWVGTTWRGGAIIWHKMNVRFLIKSIAVPAALLLALWS